LWCEVRELKIVAFGLWPNEIEPQARLYIQILPGAWIFTRPFYLTQVKSPHPPSAYNFVVAFSAVRRFDNGIATRKYRQSGQQR
jgi:hypothetical protein